MEEETNYSRLSEDLEDTKPGFLNVSVDWGEPAGKFYQYWRTKPCWGSSDFNPVDALYCCCTWVLCFTCNLSKMFASSTGNRKCSVINHWCLFCVPMFMLSCLYIYLCSCVGWWIYILLRAVMRWNMRKQHRIGGSGMEIGDILLPCCCCTNLCDLCQQIRLVEGDDWDFLRQMEVSGIDCYQKQWNFVYQPSDSLETQFDGQEFSMAQVEVDSNRSNKSDTMIEMESTIN